MKAPTAARTAAWMAVCVLLVTACTDEPAIEEPTPPLSYDRDGLSFIHPADWGILDGITTEDGVPPAGPTVGSIDAAGNLVGAAVEIQSTDPVPPGEKRNYLEAAFTRHVDEIWGDAVVVEEGWAVLGERAARRSVLRYTARGQEMETEVLVAVDGSTLLIFQCQTPAAVFDLVASRCASIRTSLRFEWPGADSGTATGD